ncbi:MAG: glycerol-3-phosphate dehydrogenase [Pyrinomonadaceae bacterium]|nr:glycerol-3-phosphate dehydrogenase [Pyrinomonadaceae bacterium]
MSRIPANISEVTFDVIIIGAGINGAGIARDAAMRGLQVLLLDKGDIGGGTTSWSTRLIHGGLRYLEHAELGLVRESLRERETLFRIAPHLVKPLPILLPLYEQAARGPLTIRAGMIAYDLLSLNKSLPRHRMLTRDEALVEAPGLKRDGLRAAAIYYDAQVEFAERLVVENVLSARKHGATVITHARVQKSKGELTGSFKDGSQVVEFVDVRTGAAFATRGRIIVNAAGPWVDEVLTSVGRPSTRLIGGTKGSHIIVGSFAGAPSTALYVEAESDKRPFFIIPWNSRFLIGTTDIRFTGDLDRVEIEDDEIEYLLRETNRVIPAQLSRDAILYSYAGVRPLPYTENKNEEGITRRHFIRESPEQDGLLSVVGGKLTTYRNLSEQTVDLIGRRLGKDLPKSTTAQTVLPGAVADFPSFAEQFKRDSGLPSQTSERLLRVYGKRAAEVLKLVAQNKSLAESFDEETGGIAAEVVFSFQEEMAETLADCLLRRTMVGLNSSVGIGADKAAATIAKEFLGWSDTRVEKEVDGYRSYVERFQPRSLRAR